MSKVGLKISKPNINVEGVIDQNLVWSSDFRTFKIHKGLTASSVTTVSHGLGYPPTFIAYAKDGSTWNKATGSYAAGGNPDVAVDSNNVYFLTTFEVYVILFIDPLNE